MTDRLNKTSICSIVFMDIIDYSKKSVSEQIDDKTLFNALINEAIKNVAQNDRIIIDTGDGAAITLMGAPEEALFVALTIRDGILEHNKTAEILLLVRIGINLGSVRVVKDINDRPNIIGDGINVAQRIMSFAGENQILVSRSYYEVTSRLTKEITGMFTYSGVKQDKHIREHEVYLIKPKEDSEVKILDEALILDKAAGASSMQPNITDRVTKHSTFLSIGIAVLAFGFFAWLILKSETTHISETKPVVDRLPETEDFLLDETIKPDAQQPAKKVEKFSDKASVSNSDKLKQTPLKINGEMSKSDKTNETKNAQVKVVKPSVKDKKLNEADRKKRISNSTKTESTHQSTQAVKKENTVTFERECSQAEITLNQCKK